jgi:hypothetical protein
LLGLLFFIKGRGRKLSLITCGVAIGVATLFKQTGLLLLIALIIFYLCNFWIPTNRNKNYMVSSVKSILLLLCGFFIPILVVVSYFWGVGALGQLVDYMILSLKGYGSQFAGILNLGYQFATFSIVWVLSCAALLTIGYKFIKKRSDWETLVSIWLLLTLCPLLSRQFGHYYIQILPPACLLASLCLVNIFPGSLHIKEILKQHKTKRFFTQACVVFLVIASFGISCRGYNFTMDNNNASLQYEIQTADYIQSHTASNDTILVYPYQPSIYFLSDRDSCVKVLILQSEEVDEEAQLDLLQQIIKNNPKYVVMQTQTDGTIVYSGLQSIYGYLVSNFKEVKSIGNFDIYINDSSE